MYHIILCTFLRILDTSLVISSVCFEVFNRDKSSSRKLAVTQLFRANRPFRLKSRMASTSKNQESSSDSDIYESNGSEYKAPSDGQQITYNQLIFSCLVQLYIHLHFFLFYLIHTAKTRQLKPQHFPLRPIDPTLKCNFITIVSLLYSKAIFLNFPHIYHT